MGVSKSLSMIAESMEADATGKSRLVLIVDEEPALNPATHVTSQYAIRVTRFTYALSGSLERFTCWRRHTQTALTPIYANLVFSLYITRFVPGFKSVWQSVIVPPCVPVYPTMPAPTRRTHNKSRGGCFECKRRKIKVHALYNNTNAM